MTREEAIALFEKQLTAAQVVLDSGFGSNPGENDSLYRRRKEMAEIALTALRPISREQVERVWRAEWIRYEDSHEQATKYICSQCGDYHAFREDYGEYTFNGNYLFCRRCGRAMTPAAWEELRKRWEALDNESHSD